jgi:ubiquitin-protein ligase
LTDGESQEKFIENALTLPLAE